MIGPRLIDPRAKVDYFLELFRFSEEKEKVQEVLKARTQFLSANAYRQPSLIFGSASSEFYSSSHVALGAESKPFVGIKGLAQARERGPAKVTKSRLPHAESLPALTVLELPAPVKEKKLNRYSSEPFLLSGDSVSELKKSFSSGGGLKPIDTDVPDSERSERKTWMKESGPTTTPSSVSRVMVPSPASSSSIGSPTKNGTTSHYEFGSIGKVQRMIKSFSKFIPGYSPTKEGEDPSDRFLTRDSNSGDGTPHTPRSREGSPVKLRRSMYEISGISFDTPSKINRTGSACTVNEDEELRSSECTSVEDSDMQDSDSVHTWKVTRSKRGVKSLAGDIDRRKGLSECPSPDRSDNSTNESANTEKDSLTGRRPNSVKRRSGSLLLTPTRDLEGRPKSYRRNSECVKSIVDQFKVAVNSNIRGGTSSGMAKDLILYQNMPVEGPVDRAEDGTPLFRYYELVRMNFVKQLDGIRQSDLIFAMVDSDFQEHLGITKVLPSSSPSFQ